MGYIYIYSSNNSLWWVRYATFQLYLVGRNGSGSGAKSRCELGKGAGWGARGLGKEEERRVGVQYSIDGVEGLASIMCMIQIFLVLQSLMSKRRRFEKRSRQSIKLDYFVCIKLDGV